MSYKYDQVLAASLEYFSGDELAASAFATKYALQNEKNEFDELTPDDMHRRLAREFARIEKKYANPLSEEVLYDLMKGYRYIVPQGSPMSGIGNPYQIQSISNCFVIESPYDSYGGLLKTDQEQVQIMKRRGGVGFDLSTIRPRGIKTANAARTTDGIAVFMDRYSNSCREVAQGGRRGALMLSLDVHHPEVLTFVNIKRDRKRVTGANISLRLSDEFMTAVRENGKVNLRFPVQPGLSPEQYLVNEWVDAQSIWDQIIDAAWDSAEPGLLFWDTVLRRGPADAYAKFGFRSTSTNPCGEITLSPDDSCRLLLVNLLSFVKNPFKSNAEFDWALYADVVQKAQRMMDDIVDLELECVEKIINKIESDPEPESVKRIELDLWDRIKRAAINGRRTGLGITALGDALAALNIRYGSDESVAMTEEIYKNLTVNSYKSSCIMAGERGPFPVFSHEIEANHEFIQQVINADPELKALYLKYGRRNIANTTTAPAGTVSTQTRTTSGIENAFLLSYKRRKKRNPSDTEFRVDYIDELGDQWQEFDVFHPGFKMWMDVTGKSDPKDSPYWGATSADVDWVQKVKVQAAAQRWICHSISNTTNIPNETPKDVVKEIYMRGWELGCKGVTVYRDGSRSGVLISDTEATKNNQPIFMSHDAPKRPEILPCEIHQVTIRGEAWTILVGLMNDQPYEVFGGLSKFIEIPRKYKTGFIKKHPRKSTRSIYDLHFGEEDDQIVIKDIVNVFDNPTHGAFTRTLSLALRHGAPVQFVVEQLLKDDKDSDMFSFSRVISRVLKHFIKDGAKTTSEKTCTACGASEFKYQEGCVSCVNCGWSKCG